MPTDRILSDPPADLAALNASVQDILTEQMEQRVRDLGQHEAHVLRVFTASKREIVAHLYDNHQEVMPRAELVRWSCEELAERHERLHGGPR